MRTTWGRVSPKLIRLCALTIFKGLVRTSAGNRYQKTEAEAGCALECGSPLKLVNHTERILHVIERIRKREIKNQEVIASVHYKVYNNYQNRRHENAAPNFRTQ